MAVEPTIVSFIGDGATTLYGFSFEYIKQEYVKVRVDGADVPFTFNTSQSVQLDTPPAVDTTVVIARETDREVLVDFVDGSVLIEDDLDLSALQVLHLVQEAVDLAGTSLLLTPDGSLSAGGRRLSLIGDPTGPTDAATKGWAETSMTSQLGAATAAAAAAAVSEANALTSKNTAQTQATNASNSAATASTKAAEALSSASTALGYRDTAGTHASNASTSATNADTAKVAAEAARDAASASAATATTKADEAAASAASIVPADLLRKDAIASQTVAEAGTNNTAWMSPLRVAQATKATHKMRIVAAGYNGTGSSWHNVSSIATIGSGSSERRRITFTNPIDNVNCTVLLSTGTATRYAYPDSITSTYMDVKTENFSGNTFTSVFYFTILELVP